MEKLKLNDENLKVFSSYIFVINVVFIPECHINAIQDDITANTAPNYCNMSIR